MFGASHWRAAPFQIPFLNQRTPNTLKSLFHHVDGGIFRRAVVEQVGDDNAQ
jgi:hypothetical protein